MRIELEFYEQDRDQISAYFEGKSQQWEPPSVVTRRKGNKSDCVEYLSGIPVITAKAKKLLTPLIGSDVEFLPLHHDEHELFAVRVKQVQDFIDMTNPVEKKIGYGFFSEFVHIHPEKIGLDVHIFRLPQHLNTRIYVTDQFKEAVEGHKLKTFQFIQLWDTESSEEAQKERLKQFDRFYSCLAAREQISFQTAMKVVYKGKLIRSRNKIMKVENGELLSGEIFEDETVKWINPTYIPPLFFERQWYVYDRSESERVIQEYFTELSYEVNGPQGNIVHFKDENLERIVRAQLQIYKGNLTDINLLQLRDISPRYDSGVVAALSGIEHAKNLIEFMISDNLNFDVAELKHLPESLRVLVVDKHGLATIEILKVLNLPKLSYVRFADNSITDLSPLALFPALTDINVENNRIEDILPLNQLVELDCIILRQNPVKNLDKLELPKLRYLYIDGIATEDWGFLLSGFPKLEYVSISSETMTTASRKSMREVIRKKKFRISWTQPDGSIKEYNASIRRR